MKCQGRGCDNEATMVLLTRSENTGVERQIRSCQACWDMLNTAQEFWPAATDKNVVRIKRLKTGGNN